MVVFTRLKMIPNRSVITSIALASSTITSTSPKGMVDAAIATAGLRVGIESEYIPVSSAPLPRRCGEAANPFFQLDHNEGEDSDGDNVEPGLAPYGICVEKPVEYGQIRESKLR